MKKLFNYYNKLNIMVKASLWFTICSIIQKGISIITMPIFTRIMTQEEYGKYSIFLTWYNLLLIIVTLNIHSEIFNKGLAEHKESMNKFMVNQIGLATVLTFSFFLIYCFINNIISRITGIPNYLMFFMFLEIWSNTIIGFWLAKNRFEYNYKIIVITIFISSLVTPILGIIAVINFSYKVEARIISSSIVPFILAIIILFSYKEHGRFFDNKKLWKKTLLLSLPLIPHYLSLVLLNQSDKLMIDYYISTQAAAIYSVAHSAGLIMTIINNSLNSAFVPWLYDKLKTRNYDNIANVTSIISTIVLLCNILIIWCGPEAIKILSTSQYYNSIWCLIPIAMSVFFFFIYTLFVDIEIYYEKNIYVAIASISATLLNLILNLIFIPKFGYIAAGYTTLISYFMTMIMHFIFTLRIINKKKIMINQLFDFKYLTFLSLLLIISSIIAALLYNYFFARMLVLAFIVICLFFYKNKIIEVLKELKRKKD